MACLTLLERHCQAVMQAVGNRLGIVRIDDQRVGQLFRRAGKTREYEHAGIGWILCRHELLGDEVHAVAQRRDDTQAGQPVEAGQRRSADRPGDVADWCPIGFGIAAVDVADGAIEFPAQTTIIRQLLTRGSGDLEEGDPLAVLRVAGEQVIDRLDPIGQALGIIQPVDADAERAAA
jgi:hypothetical protein